MVLKRVLTKVDFPKPDSPMRELELSDAARKNENDGTNRRPSW